MNFLLSGDEVATVIEKNEGLISPTLIKEERSNTNTARRKSRKPLHFTILRNNSSWFFKLNRFSGASISKSG